MHGNTKIYGICNGVFYATRPEGTETWYANREERNAALAALRDRAIERGLSKGAAQNGIYAIVERLAVLRREYDGHHVQCGDDSLEAALD